MRAPNKWPAMIAYGAHPARWVRLRVRPRRPPKGRRSAGHDINRGDQAGSTDYRELTMKRSAVRKAIRAAALSLLLMTATGVAGLEMIGTGSAMAAQQDAPGGDAQGSQGSGTQQPGTTNPNSPGGSNQGGQTGGLPVIGSLPLLG